MLAITLKALSTAMKSLPPTHPKFQELARLHAALLDEFLLSTNGRAI